MKLRLKIGAAVIAALCAGAFLTGRIPNTIPYWERQAKVEVAEMMIDPSSPTFLNVRSIMQGSTVLGVCGEVNAKNRMGAYSGFTQFYMDLTLKEVNVDPQEPDALAEFNRQARNCAEMRASEYASPSTVQMACSSADKALAAKVRQEMFDQANQNLCQAAH